jgi:hypothetical protein
LNDHEGRSAHSIASLPILHSNVFQVISLE